MHQSAIYRIRQISTGLIYIGASSNIRKRWNQHKRELRTNKHHNANLQRAWNIAGENDFSFEIIEQCNPPELEYTEQFYLDRIQPFLPDVGFNIASKVEKFSLGVKRGDETKKILSMAMSGSNHPNWGKPANKEAHEKTMAKVRGVNRPNCGKRKVFQIRAPDGTIVEFDGIRRFCRAYGLNDGNISSVLGGKLSSSRGWRKV